VLVDEHDERQYAAEILRLGKDQELSEEIARNARAYAVEHFNYRVLQARLETLIEGEITRAKSVILQAGHHALRAWSVWILITRTALDYGIGFPLA
jgi:hypothetical protein